MDLYKIISELHERLKILDEAIANLETLSRGEEVPRRKRGRPPKRTARPNDDDAAKKLDEMGFVVLARRRGRPRKDPFKSPGESSGLTGAGSEPSQR